MTTNWQKIILAEKKSQYFNNIRTEMRNCSKTHKSVMPKKNEIFAAFKNTPLDKTKVVILGQDPYHGENQANGLAFSVNKNIRIPPSLKNIFKTIEIDLGISPPKHGDLTYWAEQGVLLLNTSLTVIKNQPNSHSNIGWQTFTNNIISIISQQKQHVVFLLWGNNAIQKQTLIDQSKHTILSAPHPSPLSAHRGFFSCNHFSLTNKALCKNNQTIIDWSIPS